MESDSEFLYHEPCPECGSSDALARYTDGHGKCFSCGKYFHADGDAPKPRSTHKMAGDLIPAGEAVALRKRCLSEETCAKWGYTVGDFGGVPVQVAAYRSPEGHVVAQKIRFSNKEMKTRGDFKQVGLYGQHLWSGGGQKVVVTEGEIDAMSMSQVQNHRWPVVSIPNGAQGAAKALTKALGFLLTFDEIILMFDMDEEGINAASKCALLFPPGRCKIAKLPLKDPNEMLVEGRAKELVSAVFEAQVFRPDGIVTVSDVRDRVLAPKPVGLPWYCPAMTSMTYGRRTGEIYALGAGTGVGKTDFLTEQMQYDIGVLNEKIGVFALEQHPAETVTRLAGKMVSLRLHVPDAGWEVSDLVSAVDLLEEADALRMYDSFGATDWEIIQNTIRHLAHGDGIRIFYLDHLTALAAAEEDERKGLEKIMSEMGSLVKELDIMIILVSHLATPDGKPHEEGGRVMIRHFKGSRAIGFWCHFMFGMERDQQHDDPILRRTTTFRCLKDRFTGSATGEIFFLQYDQASGRLSETAYNPFEEERALHEGVDDEDSPF